MRIIQEIRRLKNRLSQAVYTARVGAEVGARLKAAGYGHLIPREVVEAVVQGRSELCGGAVLHCGEDAPGVPGTRIGVVTWRGMPAGVVTYYVPPQGEG